MKVVFRADASATIGLGHVMRCLTLADVLRAEGAEVTFLSRALPGDAHGLIAARGHALVVLAAEGEWGEAEDARASQESLPGEVDWLVVDHYGLGRSWESRMRCRARSILVIDDLPGRPHDCDLFLDQNRIAGGDARPGGRLPAHCRCLLGPRFALLRPQFAAARQQMRARDGRVRRLLVFYGGGDAGGETLKALKALGLLRLGDLAVDVVIGLANPHRAAIETACHALPDCTLHVQVEDMANLMLAADLALGAGGVTTWERCCLGLPSLLTSIADNQRPIAEACAAQGAGVHLGEAAEVDAARLAGELSSLLDQRERLAAMSRAAMELVDGLGAQRVAAELARETVLP